MGVFSAHINTKAVCLGTVHNLVAFLVITAYTFQPNEALDLTSVGTLVLTSCSSLIVGLFLKLLFDFPLHDNLFSGTIAVLFSSYVANDSKRVVRGLSSRRNYAQNEYVLTALTAFNDILVVLGALVIRLFGSIHFRALGKYKF